MPTSRKRILAARAIAVVADAIQLGLLPLFVEGAASPLNNALDVVIGAAMIGLVGWNWVFLPTFVAELIPFVDIAPTWTVAALIATRKRPVDSLPADAGEKPRSLVGDGAGREDRGSAPAVRTPGR